MNIKKIVCGTLSAAMLLATGCAQMGVESDYPAPTSPITDSDSSEESSTMQLNLLASPTYPEAISADDYDALFEYREANTVSDATLNSVNDFAYATASKLLADGNKNRNYSPLSLYFALAMASQGADNETEKQIFDVLNCDNNAEFSTECAKLYRGLYKTNEISKLLIANSLWVDSGEPNFTVTDEYKNNLAENFYASLYACDFSDSATIKAMGEWIASNTNGTLTPDIQLNSEDVMSIINTVYFYDEWINKFDEDRTQTDVFHVSDTEDVNCDFMNAKFISHGYTIGENFTRSALGLKENGSMVFILPDEGVSVNELLASAESVSSLFTGDGVESGSGEVTFKLPKFSFDSEFALSDMLKALGMNDAFSDSADFSKISDMPLYISSIIQQTHIAIDENGVEASAFTDISFAGCAMPVGSAEMILDRPFIYGITDNLGCLIFVGVCENPTA